MNWDIQSSSRQHESTSTNTNSQCNSTASNTNVIARLRNLFIQSPSPQEDEDDEGYAEYSFYDDRARENDFATPTPTRTSTPQPNYPQRFISKFSPSAETNLIRSHFYCSGVPADSVDAASPTLSQVPALSSSSSSSSGESTPPLSPYLDFANFRTIAPNAQAQDDREMEAYIHRHSLEIKEGKKPERPISYDLLINDISDERSQNYANASPGLTDEDTPDLVRSDSAEEWFGLEYTLELSCREKKSLDTSASAGEHSKSRESWAAIHLGSVHPLFEDEDYYRWKNWHRYLDKKDEKRRHRKALKFETQSRDLASWFVEEMRARDDMYWQMEDDGEISRNVKQRLQIISAHRPDPYLPPIKHNLAWFLKRSRSVGCLRELAPALPTLRADEEFAILE